MRFLVAFTRVVLLSTAVLASNVATQFDAFCLDWISKLAARQAYNVTHIKWKTTADGVTGEYIGRSLHAAMVSMTGRVKVAGAPDTPMIAAGRSACTAPSRSPMSSCG